MASTMLLDPVSWDLMLDASGNIATASAVLPDAVAIAQDAASAIKLFAGELWFDTTQGIPYFSQVLGHQPPLALLKAYFVEAALTVPGIAKATCFISSFTNRAISGQVKVTDHDGNTATAAF